METFQSAEDGNFPRWRMETFQGGGWKFGWKLSKVEDGNLPKLKMETSQGGGWKLSILRLGGFHACSLLSPTPPASMPLSRVRAPVTSVAPTLLVRFPHEMKQYNPDHGQIRRAWAGCRALGIRPEDGNTCAMDPAHQG